MDSEGKLKIFLFYVVMVVMASACSSSFWDTVGRDARGSKEEVPYSAYLNVMTSMNFTPAGHFIGPSAKSVHDFLFLPFSSRESSSVWNQGKYLNETLTF